MTENVAEAAFITRERYNEIVSEILSGVISDATSPMEVKTVFLMTAVVLTGKIEKRIFGTEQ